MEVNKRFNSASPPSFYTDRSVDTSISSRNSRYQTADEGSENGSDSEHFCDLETDIANQDQYTIPRSQTRSHVSENTPLLIEYSLSGRQTEKRPTKWMNVK